MSTVLINTEGLRHGMDCPAFNSAVINKGTARIPVQVVAGQSPIATGTVEFRDRSTNALLASMSTLSGTTLNQSVGACKIVVTPDNLRELVQLEVYTDTGTPTPERAGQVKPFSGIRFWGPYD